MTRDWRDMRDDLPTQHEVRRETARFSGFAISIGVGALILAVVFGSMAIFGWGFFQRSTADFRGETSAIERIYADPEYRISTYNRFFDLCAAAQTKQDQIDNLLTERPTAGADRKPIIDASVTALRNSLSGSVNDYNSLARRDFTAAAFRDLDLPFSLDASQEISCAA